MQCGTQASEVEMGHDRAVVREPRAQAGRFIPDFPQLGREGRDPPSRGSADQDLIYRVPVCPVRKVQVVIAVQELEQSRVGFGRDIEIAAEDEGPSRRPSDSDPGRLPYVLRGSG